ncbi:Glycosyltransferase family 29 (sialyltransferase) family protein isoform 1 [Hibiscus syriacus]|uniref:Glycosyltransferase family 29 (Sialyltransferase) family protein isoform 1 n=1 Tax=Hibiscus syriacus TaxID=106335 RepID=A0A6A3C2G9_HIBSY|nr:uncharacterized protein LOC120208332 [Hibiscus syriacus]KAE8721362.1 Glycosyltransferase family 29 (sialyltransferase) family protein isoform 1 [Hibiscus syriacus]
MEDIQPLDAQLNGVVAPLAVTSSETVAVGPKRQRRPSVRLGDIGGDLSYDSLARRPSSSSAATKQWKHLSAAAAGTKSSKTRVLTNLTTDFSEPLDDETEANNNNRNLDGAAIGSWRVKDFNKRSYATKRVRSNWVPQTNDSDGGNINANGSNNNTNINNLETEEDNDDFDMDNSESPMKEHSPVHSLDNLGGHGNEREVIFHGRCEEDAVRIWLNSLGLGRYAPVFEIHEVDDQVLPLLTLEDLKDMGINAVGSRRKMFCAIQKLGEGFS